MSQFFIDLEKVTEERFDIAKLFRYDNGDNYDPLTSAFLKDLKTLPILGQYVVRGEEERPELVSFRIYGDVQFWWIIQEFNSLLSFRDVSEGQVLTYPGIDDVESLFFGLKGRSFAVGS